METSLSRLAPAVAPWAPGGRPTVTPLQSPRLQSEAAPQDLRQVSRAPFPELHRSGDLPSSPERCGIGESCLPPGKFRLKSATYFAAFRSFNLIVILFCAFLLF